MALLQSTELIKHIDNLIHQETQQQRYCIDLTVTEIHAFTERGSLDFGGGEFKPASTKKIEPEKKSASDDYGWWFLKKGTYRAICNESYKPLDNAATFVIPHKHASDAGTVVNTIIANTDQVSDPINLLIRVPEVGCDIKENARLASAYLLSSKQGLGRAIT